MSQRGPFAEFCADTRVLVVTCGHSQRMDALALRLYESGAIVQRCDGAEGAALLLKASQHAFEVVLVEAVESGVGALELVKELRHCTPGCAAVVTTHNASADLLRAIHASGAGHVSSHATAGELMFAMLTARSAPVPNLLRLTSQAQQLWNLSPQQARLLYYNLWGYSNQEIAETLQLSLHTVHEYQSELRRRSGAPSKAAYLGLLLQSSGHRARECDELPWGSCDA